MFRDYIPVQSSRVKHSTTTKLFRKLQKDYPDKTCIFANSC